MAERLAGRGIACYETGAVFEVFHLCKKTNINLVVIDASVDDEDAQAVQKRFPILRLRAEAAIQDVDLEDYQFIGRDSGHPIEPNVRLS